MRTLKWDFFEFDPPTGEEEFEMKISSPRHPFHSTMARFADDAVCEGAARRLGTPVAFRNLHSFRQDVALLEKFGGLTISPDCAWPCFVIEDEWNSRWRLLDAGDAFISYCWSTSA